MKALLALLMTLLVAPVGASEKAQLEALDENWRQITEKLAEQRKAAEEAASKRSDWWAGYDAWGSQGYASWMKFQEDKVRAERASMAAFDCMFLAVQVGGIDDEGDKYKQEAERLFLYAYEQAKRALPYSANPNAFVPYREPDKLSEDFWIGTLFSDARARTSILLQSDTLLPSQKASREFRARNCDLIGVGR